MRLRSKDVFVGWVVHGRLWARGPIELSGGHDLISNGHGQIWPIADQRVNAPAQQTLHVGNLVDRPQLHFESGAMRMADESTRDDAERSGVLGHLISAVPRVHRRPSGP